MCELSEREGRKRRLGRCLRNNSTASRERGPDLARDHGGREIPRRDERADADGLLDGPDAVTRDGGGYGVAVDARGLLAEPLEEVGGVGDLALGVGRRLAVLPGDEGREVLGVGDGQVVPLAEELGALAARLGAEGLEGLGGGGDGLFRVVLVKVGGCADELAGGGVWMGQRDEVLGKGWTVPWTSKVLPDLALTHLPLM